MARVFCRCMVGVGLIAFASLGFADEALDRAIERDRQQIAGTWQVVEIEVNGTKTKPEDAAKLTVVNGEDGSWKLLSEGKQVSEGTSTFDPTQQPKTIDFTPTDGGSAGSRHLGIYELGEKTRKLCFAAPGKQRPIEFTTSPGSGQVLVKFERQD
jgi:uncharacterized protein (TIGR03067 family)